MNVNERVRFSGYVVDPESRCMNLSYWMDSLEHKSQLNKLPLLICVTD